MTPKRPPIPTHVTVAWYWDAKRKYWDIDYTVPGGDAKARKRCAGACADGIFPYRHHYRVHSAKRRRAG